MSRRQESLTWQGDVSPGDWLVGSLRPWTSDDPARVRSFLPPDFEAYGRLFHPAQRRLPDGTETPVRWHEVATANGRQAHPGMEWVAITGSWDYHNMKSQPGLWDQHPSTGSLPVAEAAILATVLAPHTSTPERCWFAVWEGFGALAVPRDDSVPKIQLPNRAMLLFSGPLSGITTSMTEPPFDQRASLWWAEDRAWCVATDVDLMSTLIGATRSCVTDLINDASLEVLPIDVDQPVTWNADHINPLPPLPDR